MSEQQNSAAKIEMLDHWCPPWFTHLEVIETFEYVATEQARPLLEKRAQSTKFSGSTLSANSTQYSAGLRCTRQHDTNHDCLPLLRVPEEP